MEDPIPSVPIRAIAKGRKEIHSLILKNMSNEENKKNEAEDYSKFFEKEEKEKKKVEVPEKRKRFSFEGLVGSLKSFWTETDKKTKIELVVFLVVITITVALLVFYFLRPVPSEVLPPPLPAEY